MKFRNNFTKPTIYLGIISGISLSSQNLSFANEDSSSGSNILCQDIIQSYEEALNGKWFGFREGALERFVPENSSNSSYLNDLSTITNFIEDYDPETCGHDEKGDVMYYNCIEALLKNIQSDNETARDLIRSRLDRLEITNYLDKVKQIESISQDVIIRSRKLETEHNANQISDSEYNKQKSYLENYLEQLELQAKTYTNLALITRELPPGQEGTISEDNLSEGINHANEAYDHLIKLKKSLDEKNWAVSFEEFYGWKKEYSQAFLELLEVQEIALQNAEFQVATGTGISDQWQRIMYHNFNGEWQSGYANQEFFSEWGQNGTEYYSVIEDIVERRENYEELSTVPIIENPCGDSPLFEKYLWDLGDCDFGLIFRDDCSVGIIDRDGRPKQRNNDLIYNGNQILLQRSQIDKQVMYTFDSESRFVNGRKQYSNWKKVNQILDEHNTYLSNEFHDTPCDLAERESCIIWIEMDRPYPTRELCQQEFAHLWDIEEY